MGRDVPDVERLGIGGTVSIHAPAWGATRQPILPKEGLLSVSIHAPAWGATYHLRETDKRTDVFQSTRPHGARPSA